MVAQVWARDGLGCMADVGGDGLFRRAEVGDEHNPKRRCGRIGVSRTKLPCAAHTRHVHETCPPSGGKPNSAPRDYSAAGVSTQQTRHFRPPSQRSGRMPRRIAACRSRQWRRGGSRSGLCGLHRGSYGLSGNAPEWEAPKRECSGVGNGLSGNAPEWEAHAGANAPQVGARISVAVLRGGGIRALSVPSVPQRTAGVSECVRE